MATRKRRSPEQIVRKLMAADRLLAEGRETAAVFRELSVSDASYHRWRNQGAVRLRRRGGSCARRCSRTREAEDAKRLEELEHENFTRTRLLVDAELEKDALREIARGNF